MKTANKSVAKRSKALILSGFLFFINPVPLGFDFIPDVFGCILLYFGLAQLAFFDGAVERARRFFLYLMIVEAVHLLSMDMIFAQEIGSNRMLAVTAFSIVEGIIYVLLFKSLFGGISYFAMRNNYNIALNKCDGCAFLTYLSFFVRIAATLLPELMAIIELEKEVAVDFDEIDKISDIMSAKPLLVILLSLVALVTAVAWYASVWGLFKALFAEGGKDMDLRYGASIAAHPKQMRLKRLKRGFLLVYLALVFATDVVFDSVRILPASAMLLVLFFAALALKEFSTFKYLRWFSLPAALLFFISERFKAVYVPYGAIAIYETKLWIVVTNAIIAVFAATLGLICIRAFLLELNRISQSLCGHRLNIKNSYLAYCVTLVLWTAGYVVPYFYPSFSALRFFASVVFIWQTAKLLLEITYGYEEHISLYGE